MRAIDTNVLIRLIVRDDARQVAAAETFIESGVWVSHLVLAEVLWVLKSIYSFVPSRLADVVEMLLNQKQLAIQDIEVVRAALANFQKRSSIGFTDCLIIEIARKAGHVPVGTFDRTLSRLEGAQAI